MQGLLSVRSLRHFETPRPPRSRGSRVFAGSTSNISQIFMSSVLRTEDASGSLPASPVASPGPGSAIPLATIPIETFSLRGERVESGSQAPSVELYVRLCRLVDTAIALSSLLGLFVLDNLGRAPTGFQDFLSARLSVKNCLLLVIFAGCWYLTCRAVGLYDWARIRRRNNEAARVFLAASAGTLLAVIFPLTSVSGAFRAVVLLPFPVVGTILILLARAVLRLTVADEGRAPRVLIVGAGPRARELSRRIATAEAGAPTVIGFVDAAGPSSTDLAECLCSLDGLEGVLMRQEVDQVLIALPVKSCYADIQRSIQICERVGVPVKYPADLFTHARLAPRVERSATGPVLSVPAAVDGPRLAVKRAVDILGAAVGLLLLSPLLILIAGAIKVTSPGPVLFTQVRYGRGRRRFEMYKFRTMVDGAEALQLELESLNEQVGPTFKIRRDPRLTRLGGVLRCSSLDELPQLWNVLRGEMSLVGPRPMSLRDVGLFTEAWLMRRFSVFPGITGLWQVSGRSDLAFSDWIRLDLEYIDNWSLGLDLRILLQTIPAVVSGKGAA